MAERSAEDVLSGVLRIPVGGVEKVVPTLSIKATRGWVAFVAGKFGDFSSVMGRDQSPGTFEAFATLGLDAIVEVVMAYDQTGALGGRDWLEEHADPAQLYGAARAMGEVSAPFVNDLRAVLGMFPGLLAAVASKPPSSTNGRSRTGASTRGRSKIVSIQSS